AETRFGAQSALNKFLTSTFLLLPSPRRAGRYKLAAPVSKTGSAHHRGRSVTDAFRQFPRPLAQKQSARLITGRPRSVTARDDQLSSWHAANRFPIHRQ